MPTEGQYASAAETRALLRRGLAARMSRLAADDMMSVGEAAAIGGTTKATLRRWIAQGRCIGIKDHKGSLRLPKWQFDARFLPCVQQLSRALGACDGWVLLTFLESAHGALEGATPREVAERGHLDRVLQVAKHEN